MYVPRDRTRLANGSMLPSCTADDCSDSIHLAPNIQSMPANGAWLVLRHYATRSRCTRVTEPEEFRATIRAPSSLRGRRRGFARGAGTSTLRRSSYTNTLCQRRCGGSTSQSSPATCSRGTTSRRAIPINAATPTTQNHGSYRQTQLPLVASCRSLRSFATFVRHAPQWGSQRSPEVLSPHARADKDSSVTCKVHSRSM